MVYSHLVFSSCHFSSLKKSPSFFTLIIHRTTCHHKMPPLFFRHMTLIDQSLIECYSGKHRVGNIRLCLFRSVCLVKISHTQGQAHRGEVMYGAAPQEEVGGVSVASLVIKSAMKVRCVRGWGCGMGLWGG